jgi:undecaprenyl-diphosphatase
MAADPWFSSSNYYLFRMLFSFLPHNAITDECCKVLLLSPLLSTWVFAACFYRFWTMDDEQTAWRRRYLASAVAAFFVAVLVTLALRPWIHWPAPVLNPHFQPLFPRDFWGNGSANCFPSHSTLAYFTIGAGFWPLNRRLSVWLAGMALLFVSLPRVYVGGHYPIDVLFSCLLGIVALIAMWNWPALAEAQDWTPLRKLPRVCRDLIFFLWVFELGEAFRSVEELVSVLLRALSG